ncbi:MAG: hypothetical protein GTO63_21205, partial [Anaerolineae bacterium]|nr:hypothetical protein [Anaerolineae bacterium]
EPLPPADDAVLARIQFVTDASGYPNRPPVQEQYEIVVTGDSFTVPGSVESPWPALLEQISGKNVLNLAMPGYSPRPEAEAVKLFGLGKRPNWVIVGYFEGNDLIIEP